MNETKAANNVTYLLKLFSKFVENSYNFIIFRYLDTLKIYCFVFLHVTVYVYDCAEL